MGYQNCTESKGLIPPEDCPGIYKPFGSCGFRTDHVLNVYSSADLVNWTLEGDGLPFNQRPLGIYFRPKVLAPASGLPLEAFTCWPWRPCPTSACMHVGYLQ
jgi:hypothetical protein